MKRNFTPLVVLRKIRLSRRALLLLAYFLVISILIGVVSWRSLSADRLEVPPLSQGEPETAAETPVSLPEPYLPFDEEHVREYVIDPAPIDGQTAVVAAPAERMRWPLEGEILAGHHEVYRVNSQIRLHIGVDIKAEPDALVAAMWPGIISDLREDAKLGLLVEIEHGGGYVSQYANLADVFFAIDEEVRGGEVIARVGSSAALDASEGYFLHFALYRDGLALDPVREIEVR